MTTEPALAVDVVIFGGGIAGLWLLSTLRQQGYGAVLLEAGRLGGTQSLASQGIIHGGTKYTLEMSVNSAAEALTEMPEVWRAALAGRAGPDLRAAKVAADRHLMWIPRQFAGGMMSFFAAKAMRGKVEALKERPPPFDDPGFAGDLLALDELVLDVPSVLRALHDPNKSAIRAIDGPDAARFEISGGRVETVAIGGLRLAPAMVVCTAGAGNEALAAKLGMTGQVGQRRPLQMLMIKGAPVELHAHCIVKHRNPRVTVTSHRARDGDRVWYVGGQLAEDGVGVPRDELIASAKHEFDRLLPWLDLSDCAWATLDVDRAEGYQPDGRRPDLPVVTRQQNVIMSWPTKLALAPRLARSIRNQLPPPAARLDLETLADLPSPEFAAPPWDEAVRWS